MNMNCRCNRLLAGATLGSLLILACGGGEPPLPTVTIDPATITTLQADAALQAVQDIAMDESGQFWVLQRGNSPHVFLYSAAGQLLDLFGTTGPARVQLALPFGLVRPHGLGEAMAVWDVGNRKLMIYGPAGNLEVAYRVDRSSRDVYRDIDVESYGRPLKLARYGDRYMLQDHPDGLSRTIDYLRSQLLELNVFGQKVETLMDFEQELSDGIASLGEYAELLVPIPLWTTCESGEMVLFDPFASRLRWFGPDGSEQASDSVPLRRRSITEDDQDGYLFHTFAHRWSKQTTRELDTAVIENSIEQFKLLHFHEISEIAPYAVDIMCGPDRQVWLQRFAVEDNPLGYAHSWVVHRPQQAGLVQVEFPPVFRPLRIAGDRVLGAHTNDQGIQTGAWVPIPDLSLAAVPLSQ